MRGALDRAVGRVAIFMLVFLSTGAISGIYSGQEALHKGTTAAASNTGLELIYGAFYLVFFFLLIFERHRAWWLLYRERWMTLLILLAIASTLWSVAPDETFRRSIGLLGTTIAGLYIGLHLEPKEQLRVIGVCVGVAALLSLAAGLFFPGIGRTWDGLWQGVFFQKNTLGRMMCLAIICFTFIAKGQRRYRLACLIMIPLCVVLLALTGSVTAVLVTAGLIALVLFIPVLRWPSRKFAAFIIGAVLAAIPVAALIISNAETVLRALGKESTLTGRLPLWALVKAEIMTKPLLGFGYTAFWSTADAERIRLVVNWDVMNAHNGFLEMALGLGLVGLAIFIIGIVRNFVLALRIARGAEEIDHVWPLFFLAFCMLWDITDSTLFAGNSVFWLLYTANAFWLVRTSLQPAMEEEDETEPTPELAAGSPVGYTPA
jgi:exopolysaccharide production protein ExoQ